LTFPKDAEGLAIEELSGAAVSSSVTDLKAIDISTKQFSP